MTPRSALITGASGGIGAALARRLAGPGVLLHLAGRDVHRLDTVAAACTAAGAVVQTALLDVTDAPAMAAWIDAAGRLDLVLANAGISAGTGRRGIEPAAQVRSIFATNLDGVLNTVLPAIAAMARQAPAADGLRGRIGVVASLAALAALPTAPAYCASKAAVDAWTVGTAPVARRAGIQLTSICPGYVRTPMTATNAFPMPGLMDAERAASLILRGLAAGRTRIAFPWWLAFGARMLDLLPPELAARLLTWAPGKAAAPG